ncbi:hypothetical protein ACFWOJ_19960 [Streptomyces sp. NPDC058439]|uniref:hypothetical protein n=1 Tax=Streptomyces sp. NPDC058439 TaxID=3346500 RepID=UPI0036625E08
MDIGRWRRDVGPPRARPKLVEGGFVTKADAEPVCQDVGDDRHGVTERQIDVEIGALRVAGHEDRRDRCL